MIKLMLARLEIILLLLVYSSIMKFNLYQIAIKTSFLSGFIKEDVYVEQDHWFEDYKLSN